jgi:hypothetical protein
MPTRQEVGPSEVRQSSGQRQQGEDCWGRGHASRSDPPPRWPMSGILCLKVHCIFWEKVGDSYAGCKNKTDTWFSARIESTEKYMVGLITSAALLMLSLLRNISRPRRAFHSAVPRRTAQPLVEAFRKTTLFQKLAGHPEALFALEDFAKLMQAQGHFSFQVCRWPLCSRAFQVSISPLESPRPRCRCSG